VFDQFASDLKNNQQKTIRRFLALQVKGLPNGLSVVRQLQQSMHKRGQASTPALVVALNILLKTDLRQALKTINCPLHWVLGAKDALVPSDLVSVLQQQYGQQNVMLHPQASHAPFISHSKDFVKQLIKIAQQQRDKKTILL
jgi:pimeloyl-[acyl-carrier protein] methyl ester esterase